MSMPATRLKSRRASNTKDAKRLTAWLREWELDHLLRQAKQCGFSDRQLAVLTGATEMDVRADRKRRGMGKSIPMTDNKCVKSIFWV